MRLGRILPEFLSSVGYSLLYLVNEQIQGLDKKPLYYPDILVNHLSNFAGPAMLTSGCLLTTERYLENLGKYKNLLNFFSVIIPPTLATINEIMPFFPEALVSDPYDIVAAWVGSGVAYLGTKLLKKLL